MNRWLKYTLIAGGAIFFLLLASMLVVPWQLKKQSISWVSENTSRTLQLEKVFFNPFTLTVELEGLKLSEQGTAESFVAFRRLMISGSVRSLIDWAAILDRVELDDPFINIELLDKQEFNFSDFIRLASSQAEKKDTSLADQDETDKPFYFSFNNIVITGGSLDFTDQTSAQKSQHKVREFSLAVPFVSNISYLTDDYVQPSLRFLLNDSEIRADGQIKPFHQSVETSLTLLLDEIDLSFYAYHFPLPLPIDVKSGEIDAEIDLSYRVSSSAQPRLLLGGELALTELDLRELDGSELFRLPMLILDLDSGDLFKQNFNLYSLDIYDPQLFINRNQSGQWNFQRLLAAGDESPDKTLEADETTPEMPLIKVEHAALHKGQVHYLDDYPPGGFREEIRQIDLNLDNFSTNRYELTNLDLRLQTTHKMNLSVTGQVGVQPATAELEVVLNGFLLEPHYPYLAELLTKPLGGTLNFATSATFEEGGNLFLKQTQLGLHDIQVPFTEQDNFTLTDLSITGGTFNLQQQQISFRSILFSGGELIASRLADGSLSPLKLLKPSSPSSSPEEEQIETSQNDWKVAVSNIMLENFDLQFTDLSLAKKPQMDIEKLTVTLANLTYPDSAQSPFEIKAQVGGQGTVALSGTLAHTPLRLQAESKINALPLTKINDFRPKNLHASLKDGKLFADMNVALKQLPNTLTGSFGGRVSIEDFNVHDPLSDGELLAWEHLGMEGIKGEISPFKLAIENVSLSNYLAKILIDQDGQVNLASVTTKETSAQKESTEETLKPEEDVKAASNEINAVVEDSSAPPDISINAVTLQGGTVAFTDRHLKDTFTTTMYQLGGRVTGLSSEEQMQADVDLRGHLENHSPLTISGKLNPLSRDLYADLTIRFKDIDLVPMTPYSGTYLGYTIDKGKLYLDLNYQIKHRKINASNQVMIDQFTFGETVKSEQATSLPVSLAVALLKDSSGEIHLDLPVSGDLDDPSFSVAGTVFTILKNLLVKAATSPFALLGAMFGGDEDFSSVTFSSGSDVISEEQQQQLTKLAKILTQRPGLTLEVSAFIDEENDPEAYRQLQLHQALLDAKTVELKDAGKAPEAEGELSISEDEYPDYLRKVYTNADFPRPRNFVGLLKELPVEEMKKLLLANIRAGDEEMQRLAQSRAKAVREILFTASEKVKEQIFLKNVDILQKPESGTASRVEFNISSK